MIKRNNEISVVRWLVSFLQPYKKQVIFAVIALAISASTWLVIGQSIRYLVDHGLIAGGHSLKWHMAAVMLVVIIGSAATFMRFYFMVWLGERVSADIRQQLFTHLLRLTPAFFERERTGEIISRFTSDTTLLQTVIGSGISMALRSSVIFIGALILMLITSPKLTLYVFLAIPLVLLPVKLFGKKVRYYSKVSQDKVALMGTLVDENFHEIKAVQAYTSENSVIQRFAVAIEEIMRTASARIRARAGMIAIVMMISMLVIVCIAWLGINAVLMGDISNGQLLAFMFYAVMAGGSVATVSEVIGEIQKAAGASERIIQLLRTDSEIADEGEALVTHQHSPVIRLEKVDFAYTDTKVLQQISFAVEKGQKVAFVGHSGAGKSTLFDLLLRFYEIQSGKITIFGKQHQEYALTTLRSQFSLVSQDPVIFAGSVHANIAFGNASITREAVKTAAKLAYADSFIDDLPHQYDSELGERGVKLSGGQKQRIAIARAIAANRPILMLDEATSALDAKSEQSIKRALDSLMQDKTTLIIAHRLSTVLNADKIFVLDKGKIIATGTHEFLYQSNAIYKEFVDLQLVN